MTIGVPLIVLLVCECQVFCIVLYRFVLLKVNNSNLK